MFEVQCASGFLTAGVCGCLEPGLHFPRACLRSAAITAELLFCTPPLARPNLRNGAIQPYGVGGPARPERPQRAGIPEE